jgi:transposase
VPGGEETGLESKKKTYRYKECDEKTRAAFLRKLAKIPEDRRVWVDETGIDDNESYAYGRSPKGKRCFATRPGNRHFRISIVAGLRVKRLLAPCWFTGMCTADVFNAWFEEMLLPELRKGDTVILDNARFHQSKKLRRMARKAGIKLLFLPPYSPRDNRIEHEWFPIKNTARKILQTFHDLEAAVETALLQHD